MAAGFKYATVAAADVPSTQTNFPVYVDLSRIGITTLAEAQSVRVYADSGKTTEWAREIVSAAQMHVKVPSLTSTTSIYVDWDGIRADYAVTDTYGRNAVWTGYRAVYHLDNLTLDSTGNSYTLTNTNSVTAVAGQIGDNADFGNSNTNKKLGVTSNLGITTGARSVSLYGKMNTEITTGQQAFFLLDNGTANFTRLQLLYLFNGGTRRLDFQYWNTGGNIIPSYNITLGTTTRYHIAITGAPSSFVKGYVNGVERASATTLAEGAGALPANRLDIGNSETGSYLSGQIDEFRVAASELSANYLLTEYNNLSDEAGFWGTWTTVSTTNTTNFFYMT